MTKEGKKKKFDRKAYMRDYMKKYNQTDDGKKKSKKSMLITKNQKKGKKPEKNGWLKILRAFKSLLKSIGRATNGKRRKSVLPKELLS